MPSGAAGTRPVLFVVGCGRSGTTLVYELLACHRELGWISTWTERFRMPALAAANGLFRLARARGETWRRMPLPSEGYRLWDEALALPPEVALGELTAAHLTSEMAGRMHDLARRHCRYGRARIFLNKNTRNTRRIALLAQAFPEAVFLHVLRSPMDTVSSLLNVAFWPGLELWTRGGASPSALRADDVEQAALAAELWVAETAAGRAAGEALRPDRYYEVRYEDVVQSPRTCLEPVVDRMGLGRSASYDAALERTAVRSSVGSYRKRLTADQQTAARDVVAGAAEQLGYPVAAA